MTGLLKIRRLLYRWGLPLIEATRSFGLNQGFQTAATLAYYGFFALIPMLLLVVIILGTLSGSSDAVLAGVENLARRLVPEFSDVILKEIHALARPKAWGAFSILVLFWIVTPFTNAIRTAFSRSFRSRRQANVFKNRVLSFITGVALVFF
ncbi:MAG: YihY/virulence factor BrkB family protein, partial [Kiritimatiellae bacterium]|nr:YihY/virulence factor BrkB family protein [Kiritimatiellia bacterium]